jgi:hypothetical protein
MDCSLLRDVRLVSLIGAIFLLGLGGCGTSGNGRQLNGSGAITYQLVVAQGSFDPNGSLIGFVRSTEFPPAPPAPLSGTFDLVPSEPLPPNTGFAFTITRVQLSGGPYVVSGDMGSVEVTTLNPDHPLLMQMTMSINGQQVELTGEGSPDTFTRDSPPAFRGVQLVGGEYKITLFAAPAPSTETRYRLVEADAPFNSEGSLFEYRQTITSPPNQYTMRGSFVATPVAPLPPETRLMLRISQLNFSAGPFLLEAQGEAGSILISGLDSAQPVAVNLTATLHYAGMDKQVEFSGTGPPEWITSGTPPGFQILGISSVSPTSESPYGSRYGLRLFAVPEG